MNVLLYVMTMLMLIVLISYARLETYRSSQIYQVLFKHYMENDERGYINLLVEQQYNTTAVSSKENDKRNPPIHANPRLSISMLLDKKKD